MIYIYMYMYMIYIYMILYLHTHTGFAHDISFISRFHGPGDASDGIAGHPVDLQGGKNGCFDEGFQQPKWLGMGISWKICVCDKYEYE